MLTQSVSERRSTSSTALKEGSAESHIIEHNNNKRLTLFVFTTNYHCSCPMHILIADILESQGSTALLHQIVNRLGVCASAIHFHSLCKARLKKKTKKIPRKQVMQGEVIRKLRDELLHCEFLYRSDDYHGEQAKRRQLLVIDDSDSD